MSLPGVQAKVSVRLDTKNWELETTAAGGTHILKPESDRFPEIPRNENLCMNMAENLGLPVPPHGLFDMADGTSCFIIKRFDRLGDGAKIHTETLFQILESRDKYSGSLEMIGATLAVHAAEARSELIGFFERVLFCFLSGNGDMHLKNWAVLGEGRSASLAPCYDLVCSRLYIPGEDDSALTISAKKTRLGRADFEALAGHLGIDPLAASAVFVRLENAQKALRGMIADSELRPDLRREMADILSSRFKRLFGGRPAPGGD